MRTVDIFERPFVVETGEKEYHSWASADYTISWGFWRAYDSKEEALESASKLAGSEEFVRVVEKEEHEFYEE